MKSNIILQPKTLEVDGSDWRYSSFNQWTYQNPLKRYLEPPECSEFWDATDLRTRILAVIKRGTRWPSKVTSHSPPLKSVKKTLSPPANLFREKDSDSFDEHPDHLDPDIFVIFKSYHLTHLLRCASCSTYCNPRHVRNCDNGNCGSMMAGF